MHQAFVSSIWSSNIKGVKEFSYGTEWLSERSGNHTYWYLQGSIMSWVDPQHFYRLGVYWSGLTRLFYGQH